MDKRIKTLLIGSILIFICLGFLYAAIQQMLGNTTTEPVSKEERATAFTNLAEGKPAQTPPTKGSKQYEKAPQNILKEGIDYQAKFITNKGNFTIDLYEDLMPITVNNFVFLAKEDFYDGVLFHRVIEGFMIQGGDPTGTGKGGPGYAIEDEFVDGTDILIGDLRLDLKTKMARRGKKDIILTPTEFRLLEYLMSNKNIVLSRDSILNKVWGTTADISDRIVDVYIGYLREKVDDDFDLKFIETVTGFGYKITG